MSNADSRCYTKFDWLWKNVKPITFNVKERSINVSLNISNLSLKQLQDKGSLKPTL